MGEQINHDGTAILGSFYAPRIKNFGMIAFVFAAVIGFSETARADRLKDLLALQEFVQTSLWATAL